MAGINPKTTARVVVYISIAEKRALQKLSKSTGAPLSKIVGQAITEFLKAKQ